MLALVALLTIQTLQGRVVGVSDGDTITVLVEREQYRVRLEGIDCPESGQDFGRRAKEKTSDLVFGREVRVVVTDHDRYGRTVGRVFVEDLDVNLELVRAGMAWHFIRYSREKALAEAEREARAAKRGLWAQPNPIPPWEWRTSHR